MEGQAMFSAVSTSVRQLHSLLRCIAFESKAEVKITAEGIRFSVDSARVVQGMTFVEKKLFSSYNYNPGEHDSIPAFEISISALLDTLQIFGISDSATSSRNPNGGFSSSYATAFNTPSLGLGGTCRLSYAEIGSPLSITIQEGSVTTTCEINTYEVRGEGDQENAIPLDRHALCLKVIMQSMWLHDAISELSGTNPLAVVFNASDRSPPYFALEGQGGPFGDATFDYMPESKTEPTPGLTKNKKHPFVAETFSVAPPANGHGRIKQKYKFDLLKMAGKAMALASKVSIRQDQQGVLSLQFMVELGTSNNEHKESTGTYGVAPAVSNSSKNAFVDFRFVPLVDDDSEDEYENEGGSENDS